MPAVEQVDIGPKGRPTAPTEPVGVECRHQFEAAQERGRVGQILLHVGPGPAEPGPTEQVRVEPHLDPGDGDGAERPPVHDEPGRVHRPVRSGTVDSTEERVHRDIVVRPAAVCNITRAGVRRVGRRPAPRARPGTLTG